MTSLLFPSLYIAENLLLFSINGSNFSWCSAWRIARPVYILKCYWTLLPNKGRFSFTRPTLTTGNCPLRKYLFHSAEALPQLILNHAGPQHCNNWKWLGEAFRLCYVTWNPKVWPAEKTYRDFCCVSHNIRWMTLKLCSNAVFV